MQALPLLLSVLQLLLFFLVLAGITGTMLFMVSGWPTRGVGGEAARRGGADLGWPALALCPCKLSDLSLSVRCCLLQDSSRFACFDTVTGLQEHPESSDYGCGARECPAGYACLVRAGGAGRAADMFATICSCS